MPLIQPLTLPGRWRSMRGGATPNYTILGRPGYREIQDNDPFFTWQITVGYLRSHFEVAEQHVFDEIYNFFFKVKGYGFLVDDVFDNTAQARGNIGVVKWLDGQYRLFKRYGTYDHPITRPLGNVILSGAAAGGTLDLGTGIVSGKAAGTPEGVWTGGFLRPMICLPGGVDFVVNPSGTVEAVNVALEEQIEL